MNTINSYSNAEPSFQANLRIRIPLKNASKERVANLCRLFSEDTQEYPNANLFISPSPKTSIAAGEPTYHLSETIDLGEYPISFIEPYLDPMLAKYDDKTVAKKLGMIFRCLRVETKNDIIEREISKQQLKCKGLVTRYTNLAKKYADMGMEKFAKIYGVIAERNNLKLQELDAQIIKNTDNTVKAMRKIIGKDEDLAIIPDSLESANLFINA